MVNELTLGNAVVSEFANNTPLLDAVILKNNPGQEFQTLTRQGLLPDEGTRTDRMTRFIIGGAVLFFVALTKIMIALTRGRHNVLSLVLLTVVAIVLAYKVSNPFRTLKGSQLLEDLRTLFGSLKHRALEITPGNLRCWQSCLASPHFSHSSSPPVNFGFEPLDYLARIPWNRVTTVQIAGGDWITGDSSSGTPRMLDDRLHDVPVPVYELLRAAGAHALRPLTVILERDGLYPPIQQLLAQLRMARNALAEGRALQSRQGAA